MSRSWILKVAREMLKERDVITQYDVHDEISTRLGRPLTNGEKIKITSTLNKNLSVVKTEIDTSLRGYRTKVYYYAR